MNPFELFIKQTFDSYKCKQHRQPLISLPVYDGAGTVCAYLRPITADFRYSLPGCPAVLARWRNENPTMSPHPFTATAEGTELWLEQQVVNLPGRILFLIILPDGRWAGHLGFSTFDYPNQSCEVDGVLRGDTAAPRGLMTFAMNTLLAWGLGELSLQSITLRVLEENPHAIAFYKKLCFVAGESVPVDDDAPEDAQDVPRYLRMTLDIPRWRQTFDT